MTTVFRFAFTDRAAPSRSILRGMAAAVERARPTSREAVQQTAQALCAAVADLIDREHPFDRSRPIPLADAAEEALNRLCYSMAWFEEVYRSGRLWPGTPLGDLSQDLTFDRMIEAVPAYAVADLAGQIRLADSTLAQLRAAHPAAQVYPGPTFAGSSDVGHADADLIVDGLLLDVKASASAKAGRTEFYQLISYVLLDYDDEYSIDQVGLYLSRFGRLVIWPVAEYLSLLGCRRSLADLRGACAATLASR